MDMMVIRFNIIFGIGYRDIFGISHEKATLLALLPAYGSGISCVFGCGKLTSAMASSRIFPAVFTRRLLDNAPVYALCVSSCVGFGVILVIRRYFHNSLSVFYNATLVLACIIYVPQCVGLIVLRRKMENVPRNYRSPVGIPGAVYAIIMFVIGIIACFFFQDDKYSTLYMFLIFVAVLSLYYVTFVRYRQTFSAEEREVMFVAHVQTSGIAVSWFSSAS
jgi:ethanolamine permease